MVGGVERFASEVYSIEMSEGFLPGAPEPGSLTLLVCAAIAAWGWRRRKRLQIAN